MSNDMLFSRYSLCAIYSGLSSISIVLSYSLVFEIEKYYNVLFIILLKIELIFTIYVNLAHTIIDVVEL
jgi:hypothetical protein